MAIALLLVDLGLFAFAFRKPWAGLLLLLGALPLNSLFTQIIPVGLGFDPIARLAIGGWHDALLLGIVAAAALRFVTSRDYRLSLLEWLVASMLALGLVFVAISPFLGTALYVYRVLYEPPLLFAALLVLARRGGIPAWLPARAGMAFVGGAVASALFVWPQIYIGGYRFIQTVFTPKGERIHHSFIANGINQPRGIGLSHSPNELGAVLAVAIILVAVPGFLPLSRRLRLWALAALSLGLLLSFSRSGMLATLVGLLVLLWVARDRLPSRSAFAAKLRSRAVLADAGPPVLAWAVLLTLVVLSSGAPALASATVRGTEPSAAGRVNSAVAGITVIRDNPLGLGLGTAGPKAARFGETEGRPRILTETWYLLYAIQVGVAGLALLAATALLILLRAWRARTLAISRLVIALLFGLGAGAVFIPIIEEPTVYTPLWVFAGLAMAAATAVATSPVRSSPEGAQADPRTATDLPAAS